MDVRNNAGDVVCLLLLAELLMIDLVLRLPLVHVKLAAQIAQPEAHKADRKEGNHLPQLLA